MKRFWVGILVVVAIAMAARQAGAAPRGDFEKKIYDELADIDPDAVPIMQAADKARDAEKTDEAAKGYEEVLRRAPTPCSSASRRAHRASKKCSPIAGPRSPTARRTSKRACATW